MAMWQIMPMHNITLEWLEKYKSQLMSFSQINESQILTIFRKPEEPIDLTNISEDSPYVYQTMIHIFRKYGDQALPLYGNCEPADKHRILNHFGMPGDDVGLTEFFCWFGYGLEEDEFREMFSGGEIASSNQPALQGQGDFDLWQTNCIKFYYEQATEDQRTMIIKKYNDERVCDTDSDDE